MKLILGVDLNLGGAITYLAPATNRELNVINSHDWGRQVQLSYYSGPNPFHPPGTVVSTNWQSLGWNPIQSGDCFGFKPTLLKHSNTGRRLYTKLVPMQWPLKNVPGCARCIGFDLRDGSSGDSAPSPPGRRVRATLRTRTRPEHFSTATASAPASCKAGGRCWSV